MRKALVGASIAALAVYSADVFADDSPMPPPPQRTAPADPTQTMTPTPTTSTPDTTATPAPAPAPAQVQVTHDAQTTTQMTQAASPPVGNATTTSAITGPDPTTTARESDSVTLYQSRRPNKKLLYTGGFLFLGSYGATALVTAVNDNRSDNNLYIPVVGPWLHLADLSSSASSTDSILTAGSGVLQGAGVLLAGAGLLIPEKVPSATIQAGNTTINFTPTSYGRGSAGIGAIGTF